MKDGEIGRLQAESYWCVKGIIDHFCLNKLVKRAGIHHVWPVFLALQH